MGISEYGVDVCDDACGRVVLWRHEWIRNGKPTILDALSGAVSGLVAITPAAGYVTAQIISIGVAVIMDIPGEKP